MLEDEDQTPDINFEIACIKEDIRKEISLRLQAEVISMRYGIGDDTMEPLSMTAIGQVFHSRDRVRTLEHSTVSVKTAARSRYL